MDLGTLSDHSRKEWSLSDGAEAATWRQLSDQMENQAQADAGSEASRR